MTTENFDSLTALRFVNGNVAGINAFRAMLNEASPADADPATRILKTISEAVSTANDLAADMARKSAAVKLLELVAKSLELQAGQRSHAAWLESKQREAERCRQVVLRLESRRTQAQAKEDVRFQSFLAIVTTDPRRLH